MSTSTSSCEGCYTANTWLIVAVSIGAAVLCVGVSVCCCCCGERDQVKTPASPQALTKTIHSITTHICSVAAICGSLQRVACVVSDSTLGVGVSAQVGMVGGPEMSYQERQDLLNNQIPR